VRAGARAVIGSRLAWFHETATPGFWDAEWERELSGEFFRPYREGRLFDFEAPFSRYLPHEGLVLEAGCGTGQWVLALRARGYDCVGIDYAWRTLVRVHADVPELPLVGGDLLGLCLRDDACTGITSLGVVEHRKEGPEPFLAELYRVLAPGGRLLISVPYFNALREYRAARGAYLQDTTGLDFYQWAFTAREFDALLVRTGFTVLDHVPYGHYKCLRGEFTWLTRLPDLAMRILLRLTSYSATVRAWGHMLLYVVEKPVTPRSPGDDRPSRTADTP
jgi:SAM-dependent methyltransferase